MRLIGFILMILFLTACGTKHKVTFQNIPDSVDVNFGPNFIEAAKFCDERYGAKTPAAEACFSDYRTYTKVKLDRTLPNVVSYCSTLYPSDTVKQVECEASLKDQLGI